MRLDDETVESKVHGLLAERSDEVSFPADVAGVADDGQVGETPAQLDGNVPLRQVAVDAFVVGAEPAVYHADFADTGIVDALYCAYPQFEVGILG